LSCEVLDFVRLLDLLGYGFFISEKRAMSWYLNDDLFVRRFEGI
jgi:hypothetical protein